MKAYRFRLATVERIRELEERLARQRLIASLRVLRAEREAERDAYDELRDLPAVAGTATATQIQWVGDQGERLAASLRSRRQRVAVASQECGAAREAWSVASQRAGVLERLDEQARAEWRVDAARSEVAELDDLTNSRHRMARD